MTVPHFSRTINFRCAYMTEQQHVLHLRDDAAKKIFRCTVHPKETKLCHNRFSKDWYVIELSSDPLSKLKDQRQAQPMVSSSLKNRTTIGVQCWSLQIAT